MSIDHTATCTRLAAVALLGAAVLTACGGSSQPGAKSSSSPSPSGSAATSEAPLTQTQAKSLADAINLKSSDMPGYTATPSSPDTPQDKQQAEQFAACAGGTSPSKDIVDVSSPDFDRGAGTQQQEVSSDVTVLPTVADVQRDLKALTGSKARGCISTFLDKQLSESAGQQVTFGKSTVTTLPTSASGADGSFGYRISSTATAAGQQIPFTADILGFSKGRVEVELTAFSIGQPFPTNEERDLFALLVRRALAQQAAA